LQDQNGTIVVMDPRDGGVLAMAQNPTYDPNRPRSGWQHNKITRGFFAPGSTFKIVTAAAGLAEQEKRDRHRAERTRAADAKRGSGGQRHRSLPP
jgi:cell division protein FtsI/penicillin-binding protein 2